tara:strand:+ start:1175 stop:1585 length:411 start_codon:yes stop_codon:yes gene_type:complete
MVLLGLRLESRAVSQQVQLQGLILKSIKTAETRCCVSADTVGIIDWCNTEFKDKFGADVGDPLEAIMPPELASTHSKSSLAAMERHRQNSPTEFQRMNCQALDKDKKLIDVEISAWTTGTGVIGFIQTKEKINGTR